MDNTLMYLLSDRDLEELNEPDELGEPPTVWIALPVLTPYWLQSWERRPEVLGSTLVQTCGSVTQQSSPVSVKRAQFELEETMLILPKALGPADPAAVPLHTTSPELIGYMLQLSPLALHSLSHLSPRLTPCSLSPPRLTLYLQNPVQKEVLALPEPRQPCPRVAIASVRLYLGEAVLVGSWPRENHPRSRLLTLRGPETHNQTQNLHFGANLSFKFMVQCNIHTTGKMELLDFK